MRRGKKQLQESKTTGSQNRTRAFVVLFACAVVLVVSGNGCDLFPRRWARIGAAAGLYYSIVLMSDGTLWAWGDNRFGQLGDGGGTEKVVPVQMGVDDDWQAVSASTSSAVAVKENGALWAWGDNYWGQLGSGSQTNERPPMQVGTDANWETVSVGHYHVVALKTNGTLWVWGGNTDGQLGVETTASCGIVTCSFSPTQVGTGKNWAAVAAGIRHTLAVKTDGTLWAWGANEYGQLGTATNETCFPEYPRPCSTVPIRVGTDADWETVAAGGGHTLALKRNGTLWTWGHYWLGGGAGANREAPVQIGSDRDWGAIATGSDHSMGLKNDGTLWVWGRNHPGQLGDGSTQDVSTPIQVGDDSDWVAVAGGWAHTVAVKKDGSVWAWGANNYGQVGDGSGGTKTSPVYIEMELN